MKPSLSIKAKVTLWYTGLVLLLLSLMLLYVFYLTDRMLIQRARDTLVLTADHVVSRLEYRNGRPEAEQRDLYQNGAAFYLYGPDGATLAAPAGHPLGVSAPLAANYLRTVAGEEGQVLLYDLQLPVSGNSYWLRGSIPVAGVWDTVGTMLQVVLLAVPLLILVAAFGGYRITRRAFRPVQRLSETVAAIESGSDLSKRVDTGGAQDEIGRLGATFNHMFDRLQKAFAREQQFTSDVSHELRTPTAILIAQCEYAAEEAQTVAELRESARTCLRQARKMSTVINQLLTLSRADKGRLQLEREHFSLSELGEIICEEMNGEAAAQQVTLTASITPQVMLWADQTMIMRLLTNLVSNAIRYNQPGGSVQLGIQRQGSAAVVTVADTGLGLAPEDVDKIWDRFYRTSQARNSGQSGTGLGLALVQTIIQLHGGSVTVASVLGDCSNFTVPLPLDQPGEQK